MNYLFTICVILILTSCQKSQSEKNADKATEVKELKQDIQATEWREPLSYLAAQIQWTDKLLGDDEIKVTIRNSATLASFREVNYEVSFLTQNGGILSTLPRVANGSIRPNSTLSQNELFKFPRGTKKLTIRIISALPSTNR